MEYTVDVDVDDDDNTTEARMGLAILLRTASVSTNSEKTNPSIAFEESVLETRRIFSPENVAPLA